jgi:hypothetical protein
MKYASVINLLLEEHMKSLRNKLRMCALVAVSFAGVANAAKVIVFEGPLDTSRQQISANFAVNRELERAWVDVAIQSGDFIGEGLPTVDVVMRRVDGLHYDSARKQVLYQTGGETIVCAEDATFLWSTDLKSTGQCQLTPRTEQHKVDDGFKIREQTVAKVVFEAQP